MFYIMSFKIFNCQNIFIDFRYKSHSMRNNDILKQKVGNISFVRTSYLNEQPVNIVINKKIYKTMPLTKSYRCLNGHIKMI